MRCPVCRFDIRNHAPRQRQTNTTDHANSATNDVPNIDVSGAENTGAENTGVENTGVENMEEESSNTNTTTITPPDSLTQLAQTISTELLNAFQDIAPSQHGDITIEYGVLTDPNYVNNSNIDVSNTDVSNASINRNYYDVLD